MKDKKILRIIDANLNRFLEGLRVCEEIIRFVVSDEELTGEFKNLRHKVIKIIKGWFDSRLLLEARDSINDVGKVSIDLEFKREDFRDIFFANIQRTKESSRVLEEFSKLNNPKAGHSFKKIRYSLYQLEKKTYPKLRYIRSN